MAAIERKTKRYPTDLTDEEWGHIAPLLPAPPKRGRKPKVDLREVLNAIRYMTRTAGGWRMLPKDFPPWQTVYWWFRRFVRLMLFRTIHDIALMMDRERVGWEASPSAPVIDSQNAKTAKTAVRVATLLERRSRVASATPWWTPMAARSSSGALGLVATARCRC